MQGTRCSFARSFKITINSVVSSTPELESPSSVYVWLDDPYMEPISLWLRPQSRRYATHVGPVCACFISLSPAKRCSLPPFDPILIVGITCAACSLSASDFVLYIHSLKQGLFRVRSLHETLSQLKPLPLLTTPPTQSFPTHL